ncbi:MAG: TIM barrel protein [SAR202 cluster bacterium]|nr:TIM barrel protein [SAR202 cluster bacterium]
MRQATFQNLRRPPLSGMMHYPLEALQRLGLAVEGEIHSTRDRMLPYRDIMISAHGPTSIDGLGLNVGATDDAYRKLCIRAVMDYIDMVRDFPKLKQVSIHFNAMVWRDADPPRVTYGDYARMIDGYRQIADYAAKYAVEIVIENQGLEWTGIAPETTGDQVDWSKQAYQFFGVTPDDLSQAYDDIGKSNVGLTLDASHACTYVQRFPTEHRERELMKFLDLAPKVRHVHWSDNFLYDPRGRADTHGDLGTGTLPRPFHRSIRGMDATILLETFGPVEGLERQIEWVRGL